MYLSAKKVKILTKGEQTSPLSPGDIVQNTVRNEVANQIRSGIRARTQKVRDLLDVYNGLLIEMAH